MARAVLDGWRGRAALVLLALVVLAPVFGWAAGQVGYAEPLENAAEETGATDDAESVHAGVLPDYSVPGLGAVSGTFLSAVVGTGLTLVVATALGRLVGRTHGAE